MKKIFIVFLCIMYFVMNVNASGELLYSRSMSTDYVQTSYVLANNSPMHISGHLRIFNTTMGSCNTGYKGYTANFTFTISSLCDQIPNVYASPYYNNIYISEGMNNPQILYTNTGSGAGFAEITPNQVYRMSSSGATACLANGFNWAELQSKNFYIALDGGGVINGSGGLFDPYIWDGGIKAGYSPAIHELLYFDSATLVYNDRVFLRDDLTHDYTGECKTFSPTTTTTTLLTPTTTTLSTKNHCIVFQDANTGANLKGLTVTITAYGSELPLYTGNNPTTENLNCWYSNCTVDNFRVQATKTGYTPYDNILSIDWDTHYIDLYPGGNYEFMYLFYDSVTNNIIHNVNHTLVKNSNSQLMPVSYVDNLGLYYVNITSPDDWYTINGFKFGYYPLVNKEVRFDTNSELSIAMTPLNSNVSQEYKFTVSGIVYYNGNPMSNMRVTSNCFSLPVYTNSSGRYYMYNISKNSECTFSVNQPPYSGRSVFTIVINFTDADINLIRTENNTFSPTFTVRTPGIYTGVYNPVSGALVNIGNNKKCTTSISGNCIITGVSYGGSYTITTTATGYITDEQNINLNDDLTITLNPISGNDCEIKGNVYENNTTNPLNGITVNLYDLDGTSKINSYISSGNGAYTFTVNCDTKYNVGATYKGQTLNYLVSVGSSEGPASIKDFTFIIGTDNHNADIDNFITFIFSMLGLFQMIIFFLFLAAFIAVVKRIGA